MSIVQLLQVALSGSPDGFSTTSGEWRKLISSFNSAEGIVSTTWAVQEEDSKISGIAAQWKSVADQKKWKASSAYEEVAKLLISITSKPVYEDIVVFPENAGPSLGAPAVEFVSWIHPTSKIDAGREKKVAGGFSKFAEAITAGAPEAEGGLVGGWGQVEFLHDGVPSHRYTALIGWKSVEAHYACKKTAPFLDNIHYLMENDDSGVEMVHYKYSSSA